jgi:processed acidic surface protein
MIFFILQIIPIIRFDNGGMKLKRIATILVLIFTLLIPLTIMAAPPGEELHPYLHNLGWTKEDLDEYLSLRDILLDKYESVDELIEVMGTPLNESNVQNLLDKYELSHEDLQELLNQFSESIEAYTFIEDLDIAVNFFIQHSEDMIGMSNFLSYVGLTDAEITNLYNHVSSLEQESLHSKLMAVNNRIDQLGPIDETVTLPEEQQVELLAIFDEIVSIYHFSPTYHLTSNMEASSQINTVHKQLTDLKPLEGKSVKVALYNQSGAFIADMTLTSDMLASDFVLQTSEQILQVGLLTAAMSNVMYGELMPDTASPYPVSLLIGVLLWITGVLCYYHSAYRIRRR